MPNFGHGTAKYKLKKYMYYNSYHICEAINFGFVRLWILEITLLFSTIVSLLNKHTEQELKDLVETIHEGL